MKPPSRFLYPAAAFLIGVAWYLLMRSVPAPLEIATAMRSEAWHASIGFIFTSLLVSIAFRRWIVRGHALQVLLSALALTFLGSVLFMETCRIMAILISGEADDAPVSLATKILAPAAAGLVGTLILAPATVPMGIASVLLLRWADRFTRARPEA